jgi:hypothetical protein
MIQASPPPFLSQKRIHSHAAFKIKTFIILPGHYCRWKFGLVYQVFQQRIQHPVLKGKSLTNFSARLFRAFKKQIYQ